MLVKRHRAYREVIAICDKDCRLTAWPTLNRQGSVASIPAARTSHPAAGGRPFVAMTGIGP